MGNRSHRAGDLRHRRHRRQVRRLHPAQRAQEHCRALPRAGWKPVVAPEIEFYLVAKNDDPDYPLKPPQGRSGRAIQGGQGYSIAGINEFDELIDDIYHYSTAQGLEIDTLIHEEGPAQIEINLRHGDPVELCRPGLPVQAHHPRAALAHGIYATFMAKPMQGQPGSAMHIHQSVVDIKTGKNVFSNPDGSASKEFFHFIGGMQKYVPHSLVMMAPYVNSYRRLTPQMSCPVNNAWGYDNRTTAFRVPISDAAARRVENRLPDPTANPYLALAASLACGLLGIQKGSSPRHRRRISANDGDVDLPRNLLEAVSLLEEHDSFREMIAAISSPCMPASSAGVRDLHAGHQPLGTRIPASQRLTGCGTWSGTARLRRCLVV